MNSDNLIAFIHIPKTAGMSVQGVLQNNFGGRHCTLIPWRRITNNHELNPVTKSDLDRTEKIYGRLKSVSGHHVCPWLDLNKDRKVAFFAMVRQPVRRVASAYRQTFPTQFNSFEAWVSYEHHQNQQCRYLCGQADAQKAIQMIRQKDVFVGLSEQFDESMVMLKGLYLPDLDIFYQRKNTAPPNSIKDEILGDPHKLSLIKRYNEEDMKLFEFVNNDLFSKYRNRYGIDQLTKDTDAFKALNNKKGRNNWKSYYSRIKRKFILQPSIQIFQFNNKQ